MIVITFDDIMTLIILGIFILIIIISFIKNWLDSIFKKNCFKCKYYKFHDTTSIGKIKYRCKIKDRIDVVEHSSKTHYEKCNDFEINNVERK